MSETIETGWLVELRKLDGPLWWKGDGWTTDPNVAVRFARADDAQRIIDTFRFRNAIPTEHQWG